VNLIPDLPMWQSGQRTWPPCAVEHDVLSGRGLRLNPGAPTYQRIIYIYKVVL